MHGFRQVIACVQESFLDKLLDPKVWAPVALALIGYFLQAWIRMVLRRKEQSRRAAMHLAEIKEEVDHGVELLDFMHAHGGEPMSFDGRPYLMTTELWEEGKFHSILPDDVFLRIANVTYRTKKMDVKSLRSHLKNYYVCICPRYCRIAKGNMAFNPGLHRNDLDGARMVQKLIEECIKMMEQNARRLLWPW